MASCALHTVDIRVLTSVHAATDLFIGLRDLHFVRAD